MPRSPLTPQQNAISVITFFLGAPPSAVSSGSNSSPAVIGGVIAAVVVLAIAVLILVCFCRRSRKRGLPVLENTRDIGEFQNPAYVGDPKLDIEVKPSNHYEEPADSKLKVFSSASDAYYVNTENLDVDDNAYEVVN